MSGRLITLKVKAPAEATEHMVDWSMVAVCMGKQDVETSSESYGVAVGILVNPVLAAAMHEGTVGDRAMEVWRQVLAAAQQALVGFAGPGTFNEDGSNDTE